jgi:hypothetical protein
VYGTALNPGEIESRVDTAGRFIEGNIGRLRRLPDGRRTPDEICQTRTPDAPGADATAAGDPGAWETHGSEADKGLEYTATCEEIAGQHAEETRTGENE